MHSSSRCALCRECQREDWKEKHKHHCRSPSDLRVGDVIVLHDKDAGAEYDMQFFALHAPDAARPEHWLLRHDILLGAEHMSVHGGKLRRILVD